MSEWTWVVAGYTIAYGSVAVYGVTLRHRRTTLRREAGGQA